MKSNAILFLLVILGITHLYSQDQQDVHYGERSQLLPAEPSSTTSLYIDKNGDYYPDTFISDEELGKTGSIKAYFEQTPNHFIEVSKSYSLSFTTFSNDNFNKLQEKIILTKLSSLNNKIQNYDEVFIVIHGFRKPMLNKNGDSSSREDNLSFRESLSKKDNIYFVEVYWDGTYAKKAGRNVKYNKTLFRLFENQARSNAVNTGYSLRKIVSHIEKENITIVGHSLGARVITSILFNAYDYSISEEKQKLPTPSQARVDICLIAPAISRQPFKEYYERVSKVNFKEQDNYYLSIIYNRKDFVLLKRENIFRIFGPGPRKYGDTSLGCNFKKEAFKLRDRIFTKFPNSNLKLINSPIGKVHYFRTYAKNINVINYFDDITN